MFWSEDTAFVLCFEDLCRSQLSGKDTVLREVFLISSAVWCAVKVQARCIYGCNVGPQRILCKNNSLVCCQLFVKSSCQCRLCRECSTLIGSILILGRNISRVIRLTALPICRKYFSAKGINDSVWSVCVQSSDQVNGGDRLNTRSAKLNKVCCLIQCDLAQQLIPFFIIIIKAFQVNDMKISILSPFHLRCIIIFGNGVGITFDQFLHFLRCLNAVISLRPGSLPVVSGKIGNGAFLIIIEICVLKLVCDRISCYRRHCVSCGIKTVLFIGHCQIFISVCVHAVCRCITFCCKDIVQCLMCAVSNCKIVIAGVHNIGLCCFVVIACEIFFRCADFYCFGFSRFQLFCFLKTDQLDRSFFHIVFFIIIRVRSLCIKLYHIFSCHIACVGDFNRKCHGISGIIKVFDILLKTCIGKTITKSVGNLLVIIPGTVITGCACFGIRIALFQYGILISCLIIFISCVNAFALYHIVGTTVVRSTEIFLCCVCESIASEIGHSRGRYGAYCISIRQMSGRTYFTGKNRGNTLKSYRSRLTDPENTVDVFILFQFLDLHRVIRVDQNDNFVEVLLCFVDHVTLYILQSQCQMCSVAILYIVCTGSEIICLTALTSDHNNRRIIVITVACTLGICIFINRNLTGTDRLCFHLRTCKSKPGRCQ